LHLTIQSIEDIDRYASRLRDMAAQAREWIVNHPSDAFDLLRRMKFEAVGFHPIENRPLNLVEQINQTWTYAVALAATRLLLDLHPDARGYRVAPGAHMSIPLDIMSIEEGLVGAETFAAVNPRNNGKLDRDIAKMASRPEQHRYVFFGGATTIDARQRKYERSAVQVWSVKV
jgi:hypothetical protein